MRPLFIAALCIILAVLSQAQTTTFYVNPAIQPPNSAADGTADKPFSTIAAAFAKITAGTTDIVIKGSTYVMTAVEAFTTTLRTNIIMTIRAESTAEPFNLKFQSAGQLSCKNYAQNLNEDAVKNVNLTIIGMNIETTSSATSLFYGDCFYTLQDLYMDKLNTSLMSLGNEGSAKMINITVADVQLTNGQSLYDQYSRERLEADYLTFERVNFTNKRVNDGQAYTMIRSFLQYKLIDVRHSFMEGIGFSIKGEQIGGNNKTDINIINTTMQNAKNFFFIESYGTVLMQDSVFINAADRAMHFFLTDENLSPIQITLDNCTVKDSKASLEGAAIAFQGSKETSAQFNLNLLVTKSFFENNQAELSGGALAFLLLKNGNITIVDSNFTSNGAVEGGGVLHVDKGESTMSFTLRNNIFDSNSAFTGGVFNFEFMTQVKVTLNKNIYTRNLATFEGGIGFISESDIILKDTDSNGTRNSADFEGGAWSIKGESQSITFENVKFADIFARFRGGCIFNSAAVLLLNKVVFENCSTYESGSSGGALFISEDATVKGTDLTFNNNQAEAGAALAFQSSVAQDHTFTNTIFKFDLTTTDIERTIKNQVKSDAGGLVFTDITVTDLKTPFLAHTVGAIKLENVVITNLQCQTAGDSLSEDNSIKFCLFSLNNKGTDLLSFTVDQLKLEKVTSAVPLIVAVDSTMNLKTIDISDVTSTTNISVGTFENCKIQIDGVELKDIDANFIQVTSGTELQISNGIFNNEAKRNDEQSTTTTQFIIASESKITIEATEFKFNSHLEATNGGAMKISYPTEITLKNVNFTENKASNGGALYIEGSDLIGTITNCNFTKNTVPNSTASSPGFGGAIYIKSSGSGAVSSRLLQATNTFIIQGSTFQENSGYTGGAIYTREAAFTIDGDRFLTNQAVSGGGLAIDVNSTRLQIPVLNSQFLNNAATLYGSSILQLREDVVTSRTGSTFNDERPRFEGGAPAKLKIRAFGYDANQFQYIDSSTINVTELLSTGIIKLEYDSELDPYVLTLTNIKSGGSLSKIIQISIHDADWYNLTEISGSGNNVTLSIENPVYPINSLRNESSLAGLPTKTLVNGSVTFLQEINIFAFPTSLLPIRVTASITHKDLGNLEYTLNKDKFNIQLMNCQIGEIFRKETLICDPCKPGYFSLTDPFTTSVCQRCEPEKAICKGGSRLYPLPGYWRSSIYSDNVVECPNQSGACLGGNTSDISPESLMGLCNDDEGYEGNACATCIPGYGKFGGDDGCTNCRNDVGYYVKLFVLLGIQISLIIFNVYSNLGLIHEKDKTKEKLTIFQSTVIKVVVDYAQVLGIVASIQITWPSVLGNFGSIVSKSVPSSKDAFSIDCFFSLAQGSNDNVFFYKILILNIQPFAFFVFGTLFWILITKLRKQSIYKNEQFRNNLLVTNCLISYVLQPEIVKSTLQLFKCMNLGPVNDPQNYLEKDLEVQCGSTKHLAWALGIGVPSLILWLVVPVLLFAKIMFRPSRYNDPETLDRYHFVFKRYKNDKIYWDLYIIIRKAALIFFLVFLNDLYSQIFFSFAVFIFSLHLHYKKEPYNDNFHIEKYGKNTVSLNNLETLGLMSNCFLLFGGLFFIEEEGFGVVHGFLMAIAFLVNLIFLFRVLKAFWWVFRIKAKIFIDSKKKPKQAYIDPDDQGKPQIELPFVEGDDNPKETSLKKSNSKVEVHEESIKLFEVDEQDIRENTDDYNVPKERPTHHHI